MKHVCFGYYEKGKFDGMRRPSETPCSPHALNMTIIFAPTGAGVVAKRFRGRQLGGIIVLEARDMNHAVQLIGQQALTYGNIFEIRRAADTNEVVKASEQ
jgi:hypothetical protein